MIELFLAFIFYQYAKIEKEHIKANLYLQMKNYSLFFDDNRFDIDIVPFSKNKSLYELSEDNNSLYILVPFVDSKEDILKIIYPKKEYILLLKTMHKKILLQLLLLSLVAVLISILAALYALKPLRNSLKLLEEFIKDIIHDLNTPITSILINLKMIQEKNDEIDSITRSAKNISMLHQNLNSYLKNQNGVKEKFSLEKAIQEQVDFFAPLYDYLTWEVKIDDITLITDKNAFSRILYNLFSNACKYNKTDGKITIKNSSSKLYITNNSYGIKNPSQLFKRFYKESERGLGIGLHIVEKLCKELDIDKKLEVKDDDVSVLLDLNKVYISPKSTN